MILDKYSGKFVLFAQARATNGRAMSVIPALIFHPINKLSIRKNSQLGISSTATSNAVRWVLLLVDDASIVQPAPHNTSPIAPIMAAKTRGNAPSSSVLATN